jgi:hypothetical protein
MPATKTQIARIIFVAVSVVGIILTCSATSLVAIPRKMTFQLYRADLRPRFDLVQEIYASGVMIAGTADEFRAFVKAKGVVQGGTVILDSPGGLLKEGQRLDRAIRDLGLNTDIGKQGPPNITDNTRLVRGVEDRSIKMAGSDRYMSIREVSRLDPMAL